MSSVESNFLLTVCFLNIIREEVTCSKLDLPFALWKYSIECFPNNWYKQMDFGRDQGIQVVFLMSTCLFKEPNECHC